MKIDSYTPDLKRILTAPPVITGRAAAEAYETEKNSARDKREHPGAYRQPEPPRPFEPEHVIELYV